MKKFAVVNVETNKVVGRFATEPQARERAETNPNTLFVAHVSQLASLGAK